VHHPAVEQLAGVGFGFQPLSPAPHHPHPHPHGSHGLQAPVPQGQMGWQTSASAFNVPSAMGNGCVLPADPGPHRSVAAGTAAPGPGLSVLHRSLQRGGCAEL
jgi:hypothetical protein